MAIKPIQFLEDMTGYEVVWASGLPLDGDRTASEFYKVSGSGSTHICEVKKDGFAVDIYCDGDMSYYNSKDEFYCDDGVDLIARGYDTDKKFTDAVESEELRHDMNPWFDMYVCGEHLDCVTHDINEALQSAKAFLDEEIQNAKTIENCGISLNETDTPMAVA